MEEEIRPGLDRTVLYRPPGEKPAGKPGEVLRQVYAALREKGYDPTRQIVGYLLSGDPTYITSHQGARSLIRTVERDDLLEELVRAYLSNLAARPG